MLNFTSEFKIPVSRVEVRWVDLKGHRHLCDHKKYIRSKKRYLKVYLNKHLLKHDLEKHVFKKKKIL